MAVLAKSASIYKYSFNHKGYLNNTIPFEFLQLFAVHLDTPALQQALLIEMGPPSHISPSEALKPSYALSQQYVPFKYANGFVSGQYQEDTPTELFM